MFRTFALGFLGVAQHWLGYAQRFDLVYELPTVICDDLLSPFQPLDSPSEDYGVNLVALHTREGADVGVMGVYVGRDEYQPKGILFTERELDLKIVEMVSDARARYSIPEGCEAEVACEMVGLEVKYAPLALDTEGALVDGQVIVNCGTRWRSQVEFTIYHELFHHLLEVDGEIIEHYTELLRGDDEQYKSAIERCCNQGAAEFMMPQAQVREVIRSQGFCVDLVGLIADRHGSSLIASALQLAHCAPVDCFVVLCSHGPVPKARPRLTGLYVDYVGAPARRKYMLARHSPVRGDHVLAKAWVEQRDSKGETYVPYRSGKYMPCYCEAKPVGPFTAGILYFEDPVPQGQMSLPL